MDRSAFVGASRSRQELAKPRWRPRLRRTNLRKLACAQVAGLPTLVLAADNSPSPRRLSYSSVWLWSCYRHYLPSDPGGVTPACVPGKRPADLDPSCGPCRSPWSSSNSLIICVLVLKGMFTNTRLAWLLNKTQSQQWHNLIWRRAHHHGPELLNNISAAAPPQKACFPAACLDSEFTTHMGGPFPKSGLRGTIPNPCLTSTYTALFGGPCFLSPVGVP